MSQKHSPPDRSWGGGEPTATTEPQTAWGRMLKTLCECHVFIGAWPSQEARLIGPDTHDDYCPAAIAERMREEVRAEFAGERLAG